MRRDKLRIVQFLNESFGYDEACVACAIDLQYSAELRDTSSGIASSEQDSDRPTGYCVDFAGGHGMYVVVTLIVQTILAYSIADAL